MVHGRKDIMMARSDDFRVLSIPSAPSCDIDLGLNISRPGTLPLSGILDVTVQGPLPSFCMGRLDSILAFDEFLTPLHEISNGMSIKWHLDFGLGPIKNFDGLHSPPNRIASCPMTHPSEPTDIPAVDDDQLHRMLKGKDKISDEGFSSSKFVCRRKPRVGIVIQKLDYKASLGHKR